MRRRAICRKLILNAVDELTTLGSGDILVFLPGEREIRETAETLRKHHFDRLRPGFSGGRYCRYLRAYPLPNRNGYSNPAIPAVLYWLPMLPKRR